MDAPAGFPLSAPMPPPLRLHASRRQIWVDKTGWIGVIWSVMVHHHLITIIIITIAKDIFFLWCCCR